MKTFKYSLQFNDSLKFMILSIKANNLNKIK